MKTVFSGEQLAGLQVQRTSLRSQALRDVPDGKSGGITADLDTILDELRRVVEGQIFYAGRRRPVGAARPSRRRVLAAAATKDCSQCGGASQPLANVLLDWTRADQRGKRCNRCMAGWKKQRSAKGPGVTRAELAAALARLGEGVA